MCVYIHTYIYSHCQRGCPKLNISKYLNTDHVTVIIMRQLAGLFTVRIECVFPKTVDHIRLLSDRMYKQRKKMTLIFCEGNW